MDDKYSFFIVRHMIDKSTSTYWKYSYERIRKFYPNNKIFIVDDNSPYIDDETYETINCTIINSEYKQRGEILGYYYFLKLKPSEYACIIHDSVFFNKKIYLTKKKYKFIWHFDPSKWDYDKDIINILKKYENNDLVKFYKSKKWNGCFGTMSMINYDYLKQIEDKIGFIDVLIKSVKNRYGRMCVERVLAVVFNYFNDTNDSGSALGNILSYCKWKISYDEQKIKNNDFLLTHPLIKIWTKR